jgi:hypothetical protein
MKTIELNIYQFNELSKDAQSKAIEEYRERLYKYNTFSEYALDDCYLYEPRHTEIVDLCPSYADYGKPIIGNSGSRKVFYDLDRNRHLDASNGIVINNEKMFMEWLEIPEGMHDKVYFTIRATKGRYPDTKINFEENHCDYIFSYEETKILYYAEVKFSNHMEEVLDRISEAYEYYFSDEYIAEQLEINEYEFTEDGKIY